MSAASNAGTRRGSSASTAEGRPLSSVASSSSASPVASAWCSAEPVALTRTPPLASAAAAAAAPLPATDVCTVARSSGASPGTKAAPRPPAPAPSAGSASPLATRLKHTRPACSRATTTSSVPGPAQHASRHGWLPHCKLCSGASAAAAAAEAGECEAFLRPLRLGSTCGALSECHRNTSLPSAASGESGSRRNEAGRNPEQWPAADRRPRAGGTAATLRRPPAAPRAGPARRGATPPPRGRQCRWPRRPCWRPAA